MTQFSIEKSKDFTIMSNLPIRDKNLSLKAKGLIAFMYMLPDDWDYSLAGLVSILKESRDAIKATLKELKDNGYLTIEKNRNEKGLYQYNYIVHETKKINPEMDYPPLDRPKVDDPKKQNTKEQIDKIDKTSQSDEHNELTEELIKRKYINGDDFLEYYDSLFDDYLSNGFTKKELYSAIHYIVPRVISNDFKDEDGYEITNKYGYFKNALESNFIKLGYDFKDVFDEDFFNDFDYER